MPATLSKCTKRKFVNCIANLHDLTCDCNKPIIHSLQIIIEDLKPNLTTEEKNQLKECLGEDTKEDIIAADGLHFGDDLEKLFEDDFDVTDG